MVETNSNLIERVRNSIDYDKETLNTYLIKDLLDRGLYSETTKVLNDEGNYYSIDKLKFFEQMNKLGYNPNSLVKKLGDFAEKMIFSDLSTSEKILGYKNLGVDFSKFSLSYFGPL